MSRTNIVINNKDERLSKVSRVLCQYPRMKGYIIEYAKELNEMEQTIKDAYELSSNGLSDMPRGTDISDTTFNKVVQIDKLKKSLEDRLTFVRSNIEKLSKQMNAIDICVEYDLTFGEEALLNERYFQQKIYDDCLAGLDIRHKHNTNNSLLNKMYERLKDLL